MQKFKYKELLQERTRLINLLLFYKHDEKEEKEFINSISKINDEILKVDYINIKVDYDLELLIKQLIKNPTKETKDKLKNKLTKSMMI